MMMSELPTELVEEILSRVPAKSLKRLRSTCKQWNALFKNQRFTENHFRKAEKQSMVLMLKDYRVCPMNVNLNVDVPSIEFKSELSLKDSDYNSEQVEIIEVFHCDGLLLCTTNGARLVVWNPCLGETKWIELRGHYEIISKFSLGYQINKSCRSYKILRCWQHYEQAKVDVAFGIYEFSSDIWRVCDNVSFEFYIQSPTRVSLKGNTYWIAFFETKILCSIDFTTERFKRLCLPPNQDLFRMVLSTVREEQLSMLIQNNDTSKMEIWMSNNIDTEATLSWRKSFTVDMKNRTSSYIHTYCHSCLIDKEKKVVVCCNQRHSDSMVDIIGEDDEYYTDFPVVRSKSWHASIFNYVPSLVRIQL